jgi:hypothetical protein
LEILSEKCNDK